MKCAWTGLAPAPSTTGTQYHCLQPDIDIGWDTVEYSTNATGGRAILISDSITITRIVAWVTTAPGGSVTRTFTIRDQGADTSATVAITGSATTAVWTGSVSVAASRRINWKHIVSGGTAAASGNVHLLIEYETAGAFYLMTSLNLSNNQNTDRYHPIIGAANAVVTSATEWEIPCPMGATFTKAAVTGYSTGFGAGGVKLKLRKNNTTDSTLTSMGTSTEGSATISPSFTVAQGGTLTTFIDPDVGTSAWDRYSVCLTVYPDVVGEQITGYASSQALGTTGTNYMEPSGNGSPNATESNRTHRFPNCILRKLYVIASAAPGASPRSRVFTARVAGADSALAVTLTTTATGNLTGTDVSVTEGQLVSVKQVASATAPAAASAKFALVVVIPQGGDQSRFFF